MFINSKDLFDTLFEEIFTNAIVMNEQKRKERHIEITTPLIKYSVMCLKSVNSLKNVGKSFIYTRLPFLLLNFFIHFNNIILYLINMHNVIMIIIITTIIIIIILFVFYFFFLSLWFLLFIIINVYTYIGHRCHFLSKKKML